MNNGPSPHLYYLPPGVDFAENLVLGLRERLSDYPPERMARVKLFLNSQRMRRRVVAVMTASGASFLPSISVVSELGDAPFLSDIGEATPDLRRKLELARLVKGLLIAQPELAPMSARFDLAESLASLFGEMQDEGVTPESIADLDVSGHSAHWARTQAFLKIIAPFCIDKDDPQSRFREAVRRLAQQWRDVPPTDPVIIAGSTGSRGATSFLMQEIACLSQGAVILPGFDTDLPPGIWDGMTNAMTDEDHPQFRFRKLMDALQVPSTALRPWRAVSPADPDRNKLISLALRPAPVTDQWLIEGQFLGDLVQTSANMTLIEASGPREEAVAIALVMRKALETGTRAALITPDRGLTRRVAAALTRWGIVADDSAGHPLALSAPGRLLRHVARAFTAPMTSDLLMTLLKHPLSGSGVERGQHLLNTRSLEMDLRRRGPAFPVAADILNWAKRPGRDSAKAWAEGVAAVLDRLAANDTLHLTQHVERHIAATEALARGIDAEGSGVLWLEAAGEAARSLLATLQKQAPFGDDMSATDYQNLFETLINAGEVREPYARHPLIAFYGTREARVMWADVVILGGLTDGVWPAAADPDPWLNRKMRKDAGLLLPERQIGLAAHDFQQAVAAKTVFLTRSTRDAEAETVPSRWLNRLCNLMEGLPEKRGSQALKEMRGRGRGWLDLAAALDRPTKLQRVDPRLAPAVRPSPRPPVSTRPEQLSLTRIATLIRDPYAIYARYILGLKPLDPLRHEPEDRDRGTMIHKILELFVKERPADETTAAARGRLLATAAAVLQDGTPFPSARILWLARLERAANHLLRQDGKYGGVPILVEKRGSIGVGTVGFTLIGTPDRIDRLPDGRLHLIDYKTGSPPTKPQQEAFDKQLLLAAAMAELGGFAELGQTQVARISYIGLGSGEKAVENDITHDLLDEQWTRFTQLIDAYGKLETGYSARRAIFETRYTLDYDHLSRFGEWQMSDHAVGILVGGTDEA